MEGSGFRTVTPDAMVDPEKVRTLLLCSGRITWDLMVERGKRQGDELTTAIARVEQLYPHPTDALKAEIARYPHLEHVRWVQDEPVNMGPAPFYRVNVFADLAAEGHEVEVIARYPNLKTVRWVQDEPRNMGPWPHYQLNVWPHVDAQVELVSRPESSSPAVGTVKRHTAEQKDLVARAFA